MICFLCRRFFEGKFGMRLKGWLFVGSGLWQLLLDCSMKHPWILCSYLLSNAHCGKSKGMTRQQLIDWFKTRGKEIVETYVALDYPSKVELTRMKDGKVEKVGEIEVTKVTKRRITMSLIRKLLDWFTGKNDKEQLKELKETIPEAPPPKLQIKTIQDLKAATQINTFRDVKAFCKEIRKTLTIFKKSAEQMRDASWIHKKSIDSLYQEMGNLSDKVDRLIEGQKGGKDVQRSSKESCC